MSLRAVTFGVVVALVAAVAGQAGATSRTEIGADRLYYFGGYSGEAQIVVSNPDGTEPSGLGILIPWGGVDIAASPDGARLAVVNGMGASREAGGLQLATDDGRCVVRRDAAPGFTPGGYDGVDWAPDGHRIAFGFVPINHVAPEGVFVLDTGTPGAVPERIADGFGPSWDPVSGRIAFATFRPNESASTSSEIWTVDPASGATTRLVPSDGYDRAPSFSPDGSELAFLRFQGDQPRLALARRDGTGVHVLDSDRLLLGSRPRWTPDGSKVLVSAKASGESVFSAYEVDVSTGSWVRISAADQESPMRSVRRVPTEDDGYITTASDGTTLAFGAACPKLNAGSWSGETVVGAAGVRDAGLWQASSAGHVRAVGSVPSFGDLAGMALSQPVVGIASTPSGKGYWLVASDGGIFSFGDAAFWGSTGDLRLNKPVVGMASTPSGKGYWLVASDGGIFSFGDAAFLGSTGNLRLDRPITSMRATSGGTGYWLLAQDGGVFTFGSAPFFGSAAPLHYPRPFVSSVGPIHDVG